MVDYITKVGNEPLVWISQLVLIVVVTFLAEILIRKWIQFYLKRDVIRKNLWQSAVMEALITPLKWSIFICGIVLLVVVITTVLGHPVKKLIITVKEGAEIVLGA